MGVTPLFFLECVYLSLLYHHLLLIFDTFFRGACVCMCVGVVSDFTYSYFFSMCV